MWGTSDQEQFALPLIICSNFFFLCGVAVAISFGGLQNRNRLGRTPICLSIDNPQQFRFEEKGTIAISFGEEGRTPEQEQYALLHIICSNFVLLGGGIQKRNNLPYH